MHLLDSVLYMAVQYGTEFAESGSNQCGGCD